jgi:hypothetical protein
MAGQARILLNSTSWRSNFLFANFLNFRTIGIDVVGQSNGPNNSDKIKSKQLQCCQLRRLKYIYSEMLTLDVQNKKGK